MNNALRSFPPWEENLDSLIASLFVYSFILKKDRLRIHSVCRTATRPAGELGRAHSTVPFKLIWAHTFRGHVSFAWRRGRSSPITLCPPDEFSSGSNLQTP